MSRPEAMAVPESSSVDPGIPATASVAGARSRTARPDEARRDEVRGKRAFDLTLACLALVVFAPIMLLIYVLVRLDGGPGLFFHERIGRSGRPFRCIKFRSMVVDSERVLQQILATSEQARREWRRDRKLTDDPRITRLGWLLRKSSLDELPQLFNVIAGDMSLVGPRPIVAEELTRYRSSVRHYFRCRPGITGLWQVSGRNSISYDRRVALDRLYAMRCSLALDLKILARTVWVVLVAKGAN